MEVEDNTVTAKAVAMCVLFLASLTLGSIPIKLSQWFKWQSATQNNIYVKFLLCLGGGVLLCTTFIHLLPEVEKNLESIEQFADLKFPLAELLMCVGFFIMYFVEECVHNYLHQREKNNMKSIRNSISVSRSQLDYTKSDIDLVSSFENPNADLHHHIDHSHVDHSHLVMKDSTIITLRGLLIVLALSVHELFEGLAVGLESSSRTVWYMFGAVAAHKLVIAFCIGVELVTSEMRSLLVLIYIFTFAVVSPLGIGIGILISEEEASSANVISVILQGLATGTLLYVVFFEILREDRKTGIKQYFAVLLGFCIMFALSFLDDD